MKVKVEKRVVVPGDQKLTCDAWSSDGKWASRFHTEPKKEFFKKEPHPCDYALMVDDYNRECRWALDWYKEKTTWGSEEYLLDMGCGTGQTLYEVIRLALKEDFKKLVGADISEKMIEYAKAHWKKDPRMDFVVMDAATDTNPLLFFDTATRQSGFHKITSFFCLHWVKDRKQLFENISVLLRPGGTAFILLMTQNITFRVWERLAASDKWRKYLPEVVLPYNDYMHMSDPAAVFASEARDAGFEVTVEIVERKNELRSHTGNDEELKVRMRSVDPILPKLPEEVRDEYLEENVKLIKELDPRGPVDYTGLLAILKKKSLLKELLTKDNGA